MPHASRYAQITLDRDHARPRQHPMPADPAIEARLVALVGPAAQAVGDAARALGVRNRILTLPLMVAAVLTLIWRQIPSVSELGRVLAREDVLGQARRPVSQQALSLRLRCLPAALFGQVFAALLPVLHDRAVARQRPVPAVLARAQAHSPHIWAVDGTTLEPVFHKVGLRRPDTGTTQAGGKVVAVLDAVTKLPVALWLDADASANDLRFADRVQARLDAPTLLLADAQFISFTLWDALTEAGHALICRVETKVKLRAVERVFVDQPRVRDRLIRVGASGDPCRHPVRLVEVSTDGRRWHRLITTERDPAILPTADVVDLYAERWRIEDAFLVTKRLLGLSYLWSGAFNAIAMQVWATWLFYAVLVDLTDAVAEELHLAQHRLSMEMVYRGLYHYTVAAARGEPSDPVAYLAADAAGLGIIKRRRPKRERTRQEHHAWRAELTL